MQKINKGFTLIELLVVIAVIGLLASIVLVAVNSAREKARDTKRAADIKQIQVALELFYDTTGSYPRESNCNPDASNAAADCAQTSDWWNAANGISANYLGHNISEFINLPVDPINDTNYYYQYEPHCTKSGTKQGYWLLYYLEEDGAGHYAKGGIQEIDPNCVNYCDSGPPCY